MTFSAADLRGKFDVAAKVLLVAAAFSLALPTAWVSLFLIPLGFCWLLSGRFQYKAQRIRENPAAWVPIVLFTLYGIGVNYSSASHEQAISNFLKYQKLLFIPIIVSFLDDEVWRRRALNALLAGMFLVLAVSYLKWMGLFPHLDKGEGFYAFKGRIAHSIFMAFLVYLMLEKTFTAGQSRLSRWIWGVLVILAIFDNFVLVNGRSGQVATVAVLFLFALIRFNWRTSLIVIILAPALLWGWFESPWGRDVRLFNIAEEIPSVEGQTPGSAGQRVLFIETTLALIAEHPILGGGTGSFASEYHKYAILHAYEPGLANVTNPHNEYLLTAQHIGLVGLAVLLYMGWLHWRAGLEISGSDGNNLRALVVVIGIGSLFNSLLLDAGEGKFYCLLAGIYLSAWQPGFRRRPLKLPMPRSS